MKLRWLKFTLLAWVACIGSIVSIAAQVDAEEALQASVSYRSQETVYLDSGAIAGFAEGDRLEILRAGQRIGEVEITFVATHSASCRILTERPSIQPGDLAVRLDSHQPMATDTSEMLEPFETPTGPAPTNDPIRADDGSLYVDSKTDQRSSMRVSGVVELAWDRYWDNSEAGLDFEQFAGRISLRARDIAGQPLSFRLRLRALEDHRSRSFSTGAPQTERRNRFYEAALLYDPPKGRFKAQIGRIAVSPFIAVGFLDGAIGQVRLVRGIDFGALVGSRPIIQGDSFFETRGLKYGAYTRFSALWKGEVPDLEIFVAGIREEGDLDVSREYFSLETHYTPGGGWSLHQRAEIDVNNGWREQAAGDRAQLSNLALTIDNQISTSSRLSISYDRWERYLTEEDRSVSEELLDNLLRQGLRVRFAYSRPRGVGFFLYAGYRAREGEDQNTLSLGGEVRYTDIAHRGITLSGDLLGYDNPATSGMIARLRASKSFQRGHEVALLVGGRFYSDSYLANGGNRSDQWVRLSGWLELPFDLYTRTELEYTTGDDARGQRIILSIGYRL